jgi:HSP20 family protein
MKTLTTWNPLREMEEFQNRFFGGFPTFPFRFPKNGERFKMPDWSPLVDIIEDDHEYLFKADLPEMRKDDVNVRIENGTLYISGERKTEKEEKKRKFHRLERFFGTFG